MQRLDKKTRLKIYKKALEIVKFQTPTQPAFICHAIMNVMTEMQIPTDKYHVPRLYGTPFEPDYRTNLFPELHMQRPDHIKMNNGEVWFYSHDSDYEKANEKRVKCLEKCIRDVQHNPLPAYQNFYYPTKIS